MYIAKTKVTRTLIIINAIIFIFMTFAGGSQNISTLIKFNAMNKILVANGQWWRLFCSMFIHIGILHLLMNMYFLNIVGETFEMLYGSKNFLLIYLACGLMGNLITYAFGSAYTVSAGASTSLYGLFGLALGIIINYKNDTVLKSFGKSFITIILINIIYSFINPSIGVLGHLGGLLGGFLFSGIIPVKNRTISKQRKIISLIIFSLICVIAYKYGTWTVIKEMSPYLRG